MKAVESIKRSIETIEKDIAHNKKLENEGQECLAQLYRKRKAWEEDLEDLKENLKKLEGSKGTELKVYVVRNKFVKDKGYEEDYRELAGTLTYKEDYTDSDNYGQLIEALNEANIGFYCDFEPLNFYCNENEVELCNPYNYMTEFLITNEQG